MLCKCALKVRSYECDSYGHVNNANYLNYLEYGRHELLKEAGFNYKAMQKAGYGLYVAKITIDYKKPAATDDELLIKTWPVKKGAASGVLAQEIWRKGENPDFIQEEILVEAKVTWAFVNSNGVPTRLPPEWDRPGLAP